MIKKKYKKFNQHEVQAKAVAETLEQYVFSKPMPQAVQLEEAVLGAILIDKTALSSVNFLKPDHFYLEAHQLIYKAILKLADKGAPVDILTVTESLSGIKKFHPDGSYDQESAEVLKDSPDGLDRIGGPYHLVELTNRVASAANVEYHARIILQKYLGREAINSCCSYIEQLYNESNDVFDLRNDLSQKLLVMPFTSYFEIKTASQVMKDAKNDPPLVCIAGEILKQGEISILFAEPGAGKSLLAVQIADAISKGEGLFDGLLRNEIGAAKVLYIDQELTRTQFRDRYSNTGTGEEYQFHENFVRAAINDDFVDLPEEGMDKYILQQLEHAIIIHRPAILILDNITAMSSESSSDDNIASRIMRNLKRLLKKYSLSILVLAHTTKRYNKMQAIEMENLRGSFLLSAFTSTMFAIGVDANDDNLLYIKGLKGRSGRTFSSDNVIKCHRIKKDNMFLGLEFLGLSNEKDHLQQLTPDQTIGDQIIADAVQIRANDNNNSWRAIVKSLNYPYSYETMRKKCMRYCNDSLEYQYDEATGHIKKVAWDEVPKSKGQTETDDRIKTDDSSPNIITNSSRMNNEDIPF